MTLVTSIFATVSTLKPLLISLHLVWTPLSMHAVELTIYFGSAVVQPFHTIYFKMPSYLST